MATNIDAPFGLGICNLLGYTKLNGADKVQSTDSGDCRLDHSQMFKGDMVSH